MRTMTPVSLRAAPARTSCAVVVMALLALAGCAADTAQKQPAEEVDKTALPLHLTPARADALPGWTADSVRDALPALQRSCARIITSSSSQKLTGLEGKGGTLADWLAACTGLQSVTDEAAARTFITTRFDVYQASAAGDTDGLFTGYYEPELRGSRTQGGVYQTPIYTKPQGLAIADLGAFKPDLQGQKITGHVVNGSFVPYPDRTGIETKGIADVSVLAYVDDPVKAFFLHIQGSGRIVMDDGSIMRVGYAAQNGHAYYAIGRELVKRGYMDKDAVTMPSIRDWLAAHPAEAVEIMRLNPSYVFFRDITDEVKGDGPIGGQGVPLTPGRSLAIDRGKIGYGYPVWLDTTLPDGTVYQRLMVAQDTGGAIKGAVRGDVFFGHGPEAELHAGAMKNQGRLWIFVPKPAHVPTDALVTP